jgi:hypothetical protein
MFLTIQYFKKSHNDHHSRRRLTLAKQNNFSLQENVLTATDVATTNEPISTIKKQFIEPELSSAVDVLEATTFFQSVTSGATN